MIGERIVLDKWICRKCDGDGQVWRNKPDDYGPSPAQERVDCEFCRGHGRIKARVIIQLFAMDEDARNLDTITGEVGK